MTTLPSPLFEHRIHEAADYSGSTAELQAVWLATLKMRHAHKMPLTPADFHALETMPEAIKEKLRIRALHFPQNAHLKNLARYIEHWTQVGSLMSEKLPPRSAACNANEFGRKPDRHGCKRGY